MSIKQTEKPANYGPFESLKRGLKLLARRGQRVSEARFRTAIERSPLGIHVFAPDGRPLLSNDAWTELWGLRAGENPDANVFRDEHVRTSGLSPYVEEGVAGASVITPPLLHDPEAVGREGKKRWFEASVYPVKDDSGRVLEVVLLVEDITERREVQDELERSEERLRSLVQNAPDIITVLDADGTIRYQSPAVERILGYGAEEMIGQDIFDYVHPEDLGFVGTTFSGGLSSPGAVSNRLEYRLRHKDGSWRHLEGISTNLLDSPGVEGIVVNSRDLSERKTLEEQISHQAFHDSLTGLPNRALFLDRLGHALARLTRNVEPLAVLLTDMDNFKVVNDSLGPEAGDALLAEVADRIKDCVRPQDTVARFGGDEFAVLLEDVQDLKGAVRVAERITAALEAPFSLRGREVFVALSIGVAIGAKGSESSVHLLRKADLALREAKAKESGARYRVFEEGMNARVFARLETEDHLRRAIAHEELQVHYQPNVSIETEKIVSMEAYARWEHPERGTLEAKEFLAVAEDSNLIVPLGEGVIREACRQGALWQGRYPERIAPKMSVNISRKQLADEEFAEKVGEILQETGLQPGKLWFDVAEGTVTEDEEISGRLLALRELGVHIAVDNFGVGNSSLSQLRRFPADTIKIDRALVSGIDENPQDRAIVDAVIHLARALGRTTIACGVETAEQFAHLKRLGCDLAQGTYFSKPLPADVATPLLDAELGRPDTAS